MVQNAGSRLIEAIQKQTEKISYFCSAENTSANLSVHEIRKSLKRMRALLNFYAEPAEEFYNYFNNQMRNFGIFLSPVRESFVNIQILDRISSGENLIPDKKIRDFKENLMEQNRVLVEKHIEEDNGCAIICEFIEAFREKLLDANTVQPAKHQIISQLLGSFQDAHAHFQKYDLNGNAEILHSLRKKLKRLWYQFDFIKFAHPRYFKLKSNQLNQITEHLGEDHDLFVFTEHLNTAETGFTPEELEIAKNQVNHLRELNLLRLAPKTKKFFQETPEAFRIKMEKIFKFKLS